MIIQIKVLMVLVLLVINDVLSENILFVAPLASNSHYSWNKALSLALVDRNHNVTILTHNSEEGSTPRNYTVITMEGIYDTMQNFYDIEAAIGASVLGSIKPYYDYATFSCEHDLKTKGLETLLSYPKNYKFDSMIFDVTVGQCLYPLIDRFNKPPVVAVTPFNLPTLLSKVFGNHLYTSYMPYFTSRFTDKMSYAERVLNFIYIHAEILYRDYISAPVEYNLGRKKFGDKIRTPQEAERSLSILLANTDPVLDYPIALPPNIVPVGGLHVKPPEALPKDLQSIMDKAQNGVILFSLGTNIKFDMLKLEQRQAFLEAFEKLPQIILWTTEPADLEKVPNNVVIRKWLPQNDILGHPNLKLFITHGGALSTQEAMYHGVPIIGIPFIFDQSVNVRKLVQRNVAKYLDHAGLTREKIYETIKDVMDNPIYTANMKIISKRYRDQPQTALERGIFWIEYVLRHGSAEHLVLPARDMPFYQTSNLDVLAVLVLSVFILYSSTMLIYTVCRFIIMLVRRNTLPKTSKS